jgi:hypothetical protein
VVAWGAQEIVDVPKLCAGPLVLMFESVLGDVAHVDDDIAGQCAHEVHATFERCLVEMVRVGEMGIGELHDADHAVYVVMKP